MDEPQDQTEPSSDDTQQLRVITMSPEQQERVRARWAEQSKQLLQLRNRDREFHGLEREFLYAQADMLQQYEKSKDIRHPRDVGNTREAILSGFLETSGYLPAQYAVSNTSVRVASTQGFLSREIDILLFDRSSSIVLMKREEEYLVYPAESAYGAIQVKSRLTKPELAKAFENIASYKRLRKVGTLRPKNQRGFGIIFAYDTDMELPKLRDEIKRLAALRSKELLPNLIVVLGKMLYYFTDGNVGKLQNADIEAIQDLAVAGNPDGQHSLYGFYSTLMELLRSGEASPVPIGEYYKLPSTAGKYSYDFVYGMVAEMGNCPTHGSFLRKLNEEGLEKVLRYCRSAKPMMYSEALAEAYGPAWAGTPEMLTRLLWVYNPEQRPLPEILVIDISLAFDEIIVEGTPILIPYYYSIKEGIISGCGSCPPIEMPFVP
jgi:hypothetical protein